jgi:predicted DNA-binding transcriptional regulator AlpA
MDQAARSANPPTPLLVSDHETAAICGVSRSAWHRLRVAGKLLPSNKLGRSVRWRREEIAAWVKAGCPDARLQCKRAADAIRG